MELLTRQKKHFFLTQKMPTLVQEIEKPKENYFIFKKALAGTMKFFVTQCRRKRNSFFPSLVEANNGKEDIKMREHERKIIKYFLHSVGNVRNFYFLLVLLC